MPTGFWMPSWPSTRKCWRMTCTTWFSAGRLMGLALLTASCTSSSLISRSAETSRCTPRLLNTRKCPLLAPRYTLRTSPSALSSASTTAFRSPPLHRRDLQHLRSGYILARQVHQPRYRRVGKPGDQSQSGFDLGRSDGAARKELGRIDAGQDGQRVHVRRDRVCADRHRLNDVA